MELCLKILYHNRVNQIIFIFNIHSNLPMSSLPPTLPPSLPLGPSPPLLSLLRFSCSCLSESCSIYESVAYEYGCHSLTLLRLLCHFLSHKGTEGSTQYMYLIKETCSILHTQGREVL